MASNLQNFLNLNTEKFNELESETMAVKVKDGTEMEVTIQALTTDQLKRVKIESSLGFTNFKTGRDVVQAEEITLCTKACAYGIIDPPLKNAQLRQKFGGVHSNEDLLNRLFRPTEIIRIGSRIMQLTLETGEDEEEGVNLNSGVDEKLLNEAKN